MKIVNQFLYIIIAVTSITPGKCDLLRPKLWSDYGSGIVIEEVKTVFVYQGYVHIPMVSKLPTVSLMADSKLLQCSTVNEFIKQSILFQEQHLKSMIPQQIHNILLDTPNTVDKYLIRVKRSLLELLVGGVGLGLSMWNQKSLVDLQTSVQIVRNHITNIRKAQKANNMNLATLIRESTKMVVTMLKMAKEIIRVANQTMPG